MKNNLLREKNRAKILGAISEFIENDKKDLLKVDVYEPTISHRIAVYLEKEFPRDSGYNVDCEYNKNLSKLKCVKKGNKKYNIRPDIIIHKRRDAEYNSIFIEIKKVGINNKKAEDDINKIKLAMDQLNYGEGVFIGILKKTVCIYWIEKNKKIDFKNIKNSKNFREIKCWF